MFGDQRLVAAIADRVTFNAHVIETGTESCRLRTSGHGGLTRPGCRTLCSAVTDRSRERTPGGFTGTGIRVILIL